ncbi:MAG TPA: amidohydrolase family protein [Vicinamibacterales bacterium]|jgi:imidazolonepropionase-like amidohydrolase|nr:amidohydrolase family protein [Vicinamibacterales bacterium]
MTRYLCTLALVCACLVVPSAAPGTLAIVGGTLIDGNGGPPVPNSIVVAENGRILAVGKAGEITPPPGAQRIDASGKFVIPGLMDANVHLMLGSSIEYIVRHEGRYEDLIEEAAQVALKNGLTTVFDSWGPLQPLLNVRERVNGGSVPGSRMFVAGNIVGFTGPFGHDFNGAAETTATRALVTRINAIWEENTGPDLMYLTPDQLRVEIRKYIGRGIDFLKYGATGHREEYFIMFSPEAQKVIVEECHRAGIVVQTHQTNVEGLRLVLEAGVDMMQHADWTGPVPIPPSTIDLMLQKKAFAAVQPLTAKRMEIVIRQAAADPPGSRRREKTITQDQNDRALIRSRVPLLLATDAGMMDPDAFDSMNPATRAERSTELGEGHFLWFRAMHEKGMAPMDMIQAATRNIAAAYHRLSDLGTIEKGKRADVVVLEANPLDDIENVRRIASVIKDGQVVDRSVLPLKKLLSVRRGSSNQQE